MAEIKIEKKSTFWLWVLLVFALIAIILYFTVFNEVKEEEIIAVPETIDLIDVNENNTTVKEYIDFIEDDSISIRMSLDHTYTHDAFIKLIDAINAMADEIGYEFKIDRDIINEHAEFITKDPLDTSHADSIRKAANKITDILQNMQQAKYPGMVSEIRELRTASSSINPDVLTLNQREDVKSFFRKAAEILKKMN